MPFYIESLLDTCYTCTALTRKDEVTTPKVQHIAQSDSWPEAAKNVYMEPNAPHPLIDIYGVFKLSIVTFEWIV